MKKAVFVDRDGVINELYYDEDHGIVDSPFHPNQFNNFPKVAEAINTFHDLGYLVILVSNQPGIAKKHFSEKTFNSIKEKMNNELKKQNAYFDDEYYCMHHPEAKNNTYKKNCDCRKPKPGMLKQAEKKHDIDLSQSWMIGDGVTDIEVGDNVGCKTIFVGQKKCYIMMNMKVEPNYYVKDLYEASKIIEKHGGK